MLPSYSCRVMLCHHLFTIVASIMGTSGHSYRGVFDREKEVSWGLRQQLHLCVLAANRTQVFCLHRNQGVFKRQPDPFAGLGTWVMCLTLFRFPVLSAYACSSTNHQLLAGWPPSLGIHFQLCWFPAVFFPVTTLQLHLASHTTALPVVPACFPSHYPMLSSSAPDQSLCSLLEKGFSFALCQTFHITTDSSNTSSNSF